MESAVVPLDSPGAWSRSAGAKRGISQVVVGGDGECCGEEVVGGAVEVVAAAVVPPGGARVGVPEGVLDVLQRGAELE